MSIFNRSLRSSTAALMLVAVAFAQTMAAAHACTLRDGGHATVTNAADGHARCPDQASPAPLGNDCEVHCSDAVTSASVAADVPCFAWIAVASPRGAIVSLVRTIEHALPHSTAPPGRHPLAKSSRLLI